MMDNKKKYNYVGLVGRNQSAALTMFSQSDLEFKQRAVKFKFPKDEYYAYMYRLATGVLTQSVNRELNTVFYTIDTIIDNTRKFFKAYFEVEKDAREDFDFEKFADRCVSMKRKFNKADQDKITEERDALIDYCKAVASIYSTPRASIKFERAKEVDMLILNIPEGVTVEENEVLEFVDGKARDGITVYGWTDFSRTKAYVKVKIENTSGKQKNIYYIYRNDRTAVGENKSKMLRYLWSLCPVNDKEVVEKFSRVG